MAVYSVWVLEESNISISGGAVLSGFSQGDASQLDGETITLDSNSWVETFVEDSDPNFNDSDGSQSLSGAQVLDGVTYADGRRVEAEYEITVEDPDGNTYALIGYNINEAGSGYPAYGTVEGLAFLGGEGGFPPIGVPLTVIDTSEGPGGSSTAYDTYAYPPCFTPGTLISTPAGAQPVETLAAGDAVLTRDAGAQPLIWTGAVTVAAARLAAEPAFRPILLRRDALGPGRPRRDMRLSPQHRVLLRDARAEILFGDPEVLVAARHLVNDATIRRDHRAAPVTYIHLFCADHQILFADGLEAESFRPGAGVLEGFPDAARAELFALFPALADVASGPMPPCRPLLKGWETGLLRAG